MIDVGERLPEAWQQMLHTTCSGEVGLNVGNDALAFAASVPVLKVGGGGHCHALQRPCELAWSQSQSHCCSPPTLQTGLGFLYNWIHDVNTCRARRMSAMPLSEQQFEARFGLWHLAMVSD